MKTAISVPDATYVRVERLANAHGLNRSQFYSAAAERYADELEAAHLTEAIDAVVEVVNADESTRAAAIAGRRVIGLGDEQW